MFDVLKRLILIHLAKILITKKDVVLNREIFEPAAHLKISFCTTCMGRTMHLKRTFLKNIRENINYPNLEFVLLNYNSQDDMEDWANQEVKPFIDQGIVNYYKTKDPFAFNSPKAKNLAHRLAKGDIVVNLDADNYLGKDASYFINHVFRNNNDKIILFFSRKDFRFYDTCGRIALRKTDFMKIGGYREDLLPFKGQDIDLIKRLEHSGYKTIVAKEVNFLRTIKHDDKLRVSNLESGINLREMQKINSNLTSQSLDNNDVVVNTEGFHTYNVYKNFSKKSFKI